jgi:hypothetical protein
MKLLICCATPWELKTVKTKIKSLNLKTNLDIFYLCTGIGNYETIYTLTNYLTQTEDKESIFLINIWICWYRNKSNDKAKFIQVWRIKNLYTQKELLPPIPFIFWKIESIYSSDKIVLESPNEEYWFVDMESRWIEICCNKYIIPHIFLKVPYDRIGQETKSFNKDEACKTLFENIDYKKLIENILEFNAY